MNDFSDPSHGMRESGKDGRAPDRDTQLLALISTCSTLSIFDLDTDGIITRANPYACKLIGEDPAGRPFRELLVEFQRGFPLEDMIAQALPCSLSTANGMPEMLMMRYLPLSNGGVVIGEYDNSEIGTMRAHLMELTHQASTLACELQKKNNDLRRLNELRTQFMSIAAHDLRNPISTIISYISLYLDQGQALPDDLATFLHDIRGLSDFMLQLISDLLEISIIESGSLVISEQQVDPLAFFRHEIELNGLVAIHKKIDLDLEIDSLPQVIMFDLSKIKQVIGNLLSNAIKFSHAGTRIRVTLSNEGEQMRFSVSDQGPGIQKHEQSKLFVPFGRASTLPSAGERSTGLGLAISRSIIEAHGGTIGLDSVSGKGSTFWFTLPFKFPEAGNY